MYWFFVVLLFIDVDVADAVTISVNVKVWIYECRSKKDCLAA